MRQDGLTGVAGRKKRGREVDQRSGGGRIERRCREVDQGSGGGRGLREEAGSWIKSLEVEEVQ
jgi:hypothetical protein